MGLTALQAQGRGSGAISTGEYRGATSAARFGGRETEFAALRSGCGVYDLGFRARISLTGSDRVRWLNGMVTNNVRDLAAGRGVYAFLLNPQGHILGDLYAYNCGESIVVDTDRSQLEKILATFEHYIIMDDVQVTSLGGRGAGPATEQGAPDALARGHEEVTALGIAGPKSPELLRAAGIEIPETQPLEIFDARCNWKCACAKCTMVRGEDAPQESYELWLAANEVKQVWDALVAAGATPVGFEALELNRIAAGIPLYGVDIRERDLPQETEQMRALNFNKGCYVGQEIVERIHSRGAVHRKFAGFLAEGRAQIPSGTKITAGEKEVGEITSATSLCSADGEKTLALGYIRRELGVPGREVMIGAGKAIVIQLPVEEGVVREEETPVEHHRA